MTFFRTEPLTLMISSRYKDRVEFQGRPQPMSAVRRAMKVALEAIRCSEEQIFRAWIHEDDAAVSPGDQKSRGGRFMPTVYRNPDMFFHVSR